MNKHRPDLRRKLYTDENIAGSDFESGIHFSYIFFTLAMSWKLFNP